MGFLAIPVVLYGGFALGMRQNRVRSPIAAQFAPKVRLPRLGLVVSLFAAILFLVGHRDRPTTLYLGLTVLAMFGAAFVENKLRRTLADIVYHNLNPAHWADFKNRGPHWRYEMKWSFIQDPEYVDVITLQMIDETSSYTALSYAARQEKFPPGHEPYLDLRAWGRFFPPVRTIVQQTISEDVLMNYGRYASGLTPAEVFAELKSTEDLALRMDRLQYFWCLRNLNVIDARLRQILRGSSQAAVIAIGTLLFLLVAPSISEDGQAPSELLRAVAAGSLLWLLVVCAGASLFIIRVFGGTGTFSISYPVRGTDFEPLWNRVLQVGIVSFSVSFLLYGIGSPFLLDPAALAQFKVDGTFIAYAAGGFVFCAGVFLAHTAGLHDLMLASRTNALDRLAFRLESTLDTEPRRELVDWFKDVRTLRVWPVRASTLAQVGLGILLPVLVQVILLYTGIRTR